MIKLGPNDTNPQTPVGTPVVGADTSTAAAPVAPADQTTQAQPAATAAWPSNVATGVSTTPEPSVPSVPQAPAETAPLGGVAATAAPSTDGGQGTGTI